MAGRWLLDTSALLALRDNEAGAERASPNCCSAPCPSPWPMPGSPPPLSWRGRCWCTRILNSALWPTFPRTGWAVRACCDWPQQVRRFWKRGYRGQ